MKIFAALLYVVLLCSASVRAQQAPAQPVPMPQWGTILGRVVYDGKGQFPAVKMLPVNKAPVPGMPAAIEDESLVVNKENSGLANVIVILRTKPNNIHPGYVNMPAQKQTLTSRNFRFEPHVLAIWKEDDLELVNALPGQGESFNYSSLVQSFNELLAPGGRVTKKLQIGENLPKRVSSNIYPWMSAQLFVRDNPYFCVTDERGIFCIPNLPTNQVLEFVFWHERCGYMGGMMNQAPDPAHNVGLDQRGRISVRLTEPVLDLGEFLADPKKLK